MMPWRLSPSVSPPTRYGVSIPSAPCRLVFRIRCWPANAAAPASPVARAIASICRIFPWREAGYSRWLFDEIHEGPQRRRHLPAAGVVDEEARIIGAPVFPHADQAPGLDMMLRQAFEDIGDAAARECGVDHQILF